MWAVTRGAANGSTLSAPHRSVRAAITTRLLVSTHTRFDQVTASGPNAIRRRVRPSLRLSTCVRHARLGSTRILPRRPHIHRLFEFSWDPAGRGSARAIRRVAKGCTFQTTHAAQFLESSGADRTRSWNRDRRVQLRNLSIRRSGPHRAAGLLPLLRAIHLHASRFIGRHAHSGNHAACDRQLR